MNYKGVDINTVGTPKPWGAREEQAWKDTIDGLVVDALGGTVDTVNGHQHNNLYASAGATALVHCNFGVGIPMVGINELNPDTRLHVTETLNQAVFQIEQQGNFDNVFDLLFI